MFHLYSPRKRQKTKDFQGMEHWDKVGYYDYIYILCISRSARKDEIQFYIHIIQNYVIKLVIFILLELVQEFVYVLVFVLEPILLHFICGITKFHLLYILEDFETAVL